LGALPISFVGCKVTFTTFLKSLFIVLDNILAISV